MRGKPNVFLDTDVVLDHLSDREPFAGGANRILSLAEQGRISAYVSSLSFSNLYYLLRKMGGHSAAVDLLRRLKRIVHVSSVTEMEVEAALSSGFPDFEDAIQYFTAKAQGDVTGIVTRNKRHYGLSELPVLSPIEFLNEFSLI